MTINYVINSYKIWHNNIKFNIISIVIIIKKIGYGKMFVAF